MSEEIPSIFKSTRLVVGGGVGRAVVLEVVVAAVVVVVVGVVGAGVVGVAAVVGAMVVVVVVVEVLMVVLRVVVGGRGGGVANTKASVESITERGREQQLYTTTKPRERYQKDTGTEIIRE